MTENNKSINEPLKGMPIPEEMHEMIGGFADKLNSKCDGMFASESKSEREVGCCGDQCAEMKKGLDSLKKGAIGFGVGVLATAFVVSSVRFLSSSCCGKS